MIAKYSILLANDLHVVIVDDEDPERPSVTNSAAAVIAELDKTLGGLGARKVFYRDTIGRFDEIRHKNGEFESFTAGTSAQQEFFRNL